MKRGMNTGKVMMRNISSYSDFSASATTRVISKVAKIILINSEKSYIVTIQIFFHIKQS